MESLDRAMFRGDDTRVQGEFFIFNVCGLLWTVHRLVELVVVGLVDRTYEIIR